MSKPRKYDLVMIDWLDSSQPVASWRFLSDIEAEQPIACQTIGHLLVDNSDVKVVAVSIAGPGREWNQACGVMTIPTCSVIAMHLLLRSQCVYQNDQFAGMEVG